MSFRLKVKSDSKSKSSSASESESKPKPEPDSHPSPDKSAPPSSSSSPPIPIPKTPKSNSTPNPKSMSTPSSVNRKRVPKDIEEDDNLVILNAFLDFKNHHGSNPTPTTIPQILDAVNSSLHHRLTAEQLYNKSRSLKPKYNRIATAGGPGPAASQYDRDFFDVAVKVWGVKSGEKKVEKKVKAENGKSHHLPENGVMGDGEDEEMEDADDEVEGGGDEEEEKEEEPAKEEPAEDDLDDEFEAICESYPYLARGLKGAWKDKGNSMEALKVGMKFADRKKARKLDLKWKRHFVEGLEIKGLEFQVGHRAVEVVAAGFRGEEGS